MLILNKDDEKVFLSIIKSFLPQKEEFLLKDRIYLNKNKVEIILNTKKDNFIANNCYNFLNIEDNLNQEKCLTNLQKLLNYLYNNDYYVFNWEIFSNIIDNDINYLLEVFNLFNKYFSQIEQKYFEYIEKNNINRQIHIYSTLDFCENKETIIKIQEQIEYFKKKYNIYIIFTWLTNGILDKKSLIFYNNCFNFCKKNYYLTSSIISPENIDDWKNGGYDWMLKQYQKYFDINFYFFPIEEIQNNSWDDNSRQKYKDFIVDIFQKYLKLFNNINLATIKLFDTNGEYYINNNFQLYENNLLKIKIYNNLNSPQCDLGKNLTIDCNTLKIYPCHNFLKNYFCGGEINTLQNCFCVQDGFFGYLNLIIKNSLMNVGCNHCTFNIFCKKNCYYNSFKEYGEYCLPCENFCLLIQDKIEILLQLYQEYGMINELNNWCDKTKDNNIHSYKKILTNLLIKDE